MPNSDNLQGAFTKDDAYRNLDRVNFWINNADSKASFVLAFIGVTLTIIFSNSEFVKGIQCIFKDLGTLSQLGSWFFIPIIGVIAFLALGYYIINVITALLKVLTSKNKISEFGKTKKIIEGSILFYDAIRNNKSLDDFIKLINVCDTESKLINEIHSQTLINSEICGRKFENYNNGLKQIIRAAYSFGSLLLILFIRSLI